MSDMATAGQQPSGLPTLLLNAWVKIRTRHVLVVHELVAAVKECSGALGALNRRRKSDTMKAQRQQLGADLEILMDPLGVHFGWGGSLDQLMMLEVDDCPWQGVWSPSQLRGIARLFETFPVMTVEDLLVHFAHRPGPKPSARGCAEQLVRTFPVVAVMLKCGASTHKHTQVLAIDSLNGYGGQYFWSLVQMGAQGKLETTDLGVEGGDHGDDSDTVVAEDVDTGAYGRGRPRIEDPRRFGPDIVAFVEEFILGRGQRAVDGHRLSPTSGVFGAPLQAIVVAVEEYFGQKISKTGVRNLLAKTRGDSHAAPRGVVNARPVRVVAGEKRPHPRARWSATLFKYDKQLVALLASRGVKVFQAHGDDMAKVPMVIPARPGSSPKGFVMQCEDGQAAFTQLDHSFPVAERMLLRHIWLGFL